MCRLKAKATEVWRGGGHSPHLGPDPSKGDIGTGPAESLQQDCVEKGVEK